MERIRKHIKSHHIVSTIALGGIAFAAMNFNSPPLFQNTDNFVLFAREEIKLEQGVQVSSRDLGSNGKIEIEKEVIVNGNLFADEIAIDKNTTINGNASSNKLKLHKDAKILGTQTKPVSLPIANLPEIPEFQIGTQDFKFEGKDNTLTAGSYRNITLEKDSRLILTGGAYNLRKLELKDGAVLIFSGSTTINIQFKLKGEKHVSILPGQNMKPDDLKINYLGIKPKKEKDEKEDDDNEIESEMDAKEKKDHKERKIGRPVVFGKNSFLNFKLLAPKASVHIGQEATIRGQIVARKIKIENGSVLGREETVIKIASPEDIITDPDGGVYPINEILVSLAPGATDLDAHSIAASVNGRVVGVVSSINLYQIEVQTKTTQELETIIGILRSQPKVEGVFRNFVVQKQFFPADRVEILSGIDNEFKIALSAVYLIFTMPMYRILFIAAVLLLAFYLYLKRHQFRKFSVVRDKLFYSSAHLIWFIVLSITFLLFPLTWLVRWIVPYVRGGSMGIPFTTFGGSPYELGFSIVGALGNMLFIYIITFIVVYLKRNFRKHGSLIILLVFSLLITGSILLVFVRFVAEVSPPFMPSPLFRTIFGYEVYAAPQIKYDLENLRNQNSSFTKAYDIIQIQQAWDMVASATPPISSLIIGIVDFGVEAAHQEFNAPEVDLGSVSRVLLEDFIRPTIFDLGGHGTQVTGIVGANNISRSSVLPSNSPQMNGILSGVLSENQYTLEFKPIGGPPTVGTSTYLQVVGALDAAIKRNSQIVNMSFGAAFCPALSIFSGRECYKTAQEFNDAFNVYKRLFQQAPNTLFVAGAGNDDIDASQSLPGSLSLLANVITVGATDLDDRRAQFIFPEKSNFGSDVNISAPGKNVYAPAPNDKYDSNFVGTSASAPMVTGVAGLIKAIKPNLTPVQIKQVIQESADPIFAPIGSDEAGKKLGFGCVATSTPPGMVLRGCRLNAERAVCHPLVLDCPIVPPPPPPPVGVPITCPTEPLKIITEDSFIPLSESPCVVDVLGIQSGATLTIEPGVILKFATTTSEIVVVGNLVSGGTPSQPIVFTSLRDDVGGDTNNDGSATVPAPRDWRGIGLFGTAHFNHSTVRFGGGSSGGIRMEPNATLSFLNGNISHNFGSNIRIRFNDIVTISSSTVADANFGIHAEEPPATLTLTNTTFQNHDIPLSLSPDVNFIHSGNTATNNNINGIVMRGITASNRTWTKDLMPYIIPSDPANGFVAVASGTTLTIDPGVVVKFAFPTSQLIVLTNGNLNVNGTLSQPVFFTSIKDDTVGGDTNNDGSATVPAPLNWRYINVFGTANFNHSTVRFAGGGGAGIVAGFGATLSFLNGHLSQNSFSNIFAGPNTNITIASSIFDNANFGINTQPPGPLTLTLTNTSFQNHDIPVFLSPATNFIHSGNTATNNNLNGFVLNGTTQADRTWTKDLMPYIVFSDFNSSTSTVAVASGTTLTIGPGVVVKFAFPTSQLVVLSNGNLNVNGTLSQPVFFTSIKDDTVGGDTNNDGSATIPAPGDWWDIHLFSTANVNHSSVRFGGRGGGGIVLEPFSVLSLSHSRLTKNLNSNIFVRGTSTIFSSEIDNSTTGIFQFGGTVNVSQSSIHDNSSFGAFHSFGTPVDARNNWWGSPTGPFHSTLNPGGLGNAVSDNVDFIPFLTTDPVGSLP